MTKRMLIDATHAEETRVVLLDGNRLEDFDVESSTRKQLKGNIYLAKVVRVEPSLQAAFVEYGGGRHGFLAFGEIHPDYYQIPVADRERLLKMQADEARAEAEADDDEVDERPRRPPHRAPRHGSPHRDTVRQDAPLPEAAEPGAEQPDLVFTAPETAPATDAEERGHDGEAAGDDPDRPAQPLPIHQDVKFGEVTHGEVTHGEVVGGELTGGEITDHDAPQTAASEVVEPAENGDPDFETGEPEQPPPELIGGESDVFEGNGADEARARRAARFLRNYRIQEVIHRRQIMLIQVVKEERGTKGAALTTYISLAGRYSVLMPNSPRGGGVSRKITSAADRRRLKEITAELDVPQGMGIIVRTAGANRPKPEIRRDCEYLMRLWDDIREHTLKSVAPALIYEEASLIKRSIRDVYSRDVDEVVVDGEDGWRAAHDFMRMIMPSHAKKVILWRPEAHGGGQPLFAKHGVEAQLDAMVAPSVQLKSGGYLVINQAEALVAIDVNSGRATRERGIEETALKTNLEAADEVARQLRLRDLAGLIVIDFIDMESRRNNAMVERRLKDALKNDRARIQVGQISHFGLLEMSRQRLRPSLAETSFVTCPHCGGLGHVRGIECSALHVLRAIEDEAGKGRASLITVHVANAIVMYVLNHKRARLGEIEARYAIQVHFSADETLTPPQMRIDRTRPPIPREERVQSAPITGPVAPVPMSVMDDEDDEAADVVFDTDAEPPRRAPPAPRRAESRPEPRSEARAEARAEALTDPLAPAAATSAAETPEAAASEEAERKRRRRRRRGGRRDEAGNEIPVVAQETAPPLLPLGEPSDDHQEVTEAAIEPLITSSDASTEVPGRELPSSEAAGTEAAGTEAGGLDENGQPRSRRRGRRGGRRRGRREGPDGEELPQEEASPQPAPRPVAAPAPAPFVPPPYVHTYTGPTPADPFGGQAFDIFDIMDQAEQAQQEPPPRPKPAAPVVEAPIPVTPVVATPEPEPASPPEPVAGPAIKPIVIGQDEVPATERKRGWWRR